jgi:trimeric autotransporter adhesin
MNIRSVRLARAMTLAASIPVLSVLVFAQTAKPIRATRTSIDGPSSLVLYKDTYLFVAQFGDYKPRIRRIDLKNHTIITVAGNGDDCCYLEGAPATEVGFDWISSIAVDSHGNLFIADSEHVRKVDARNGHMVTVAGNGKGGNPVEGLPALSTAFGSIQGLAVDSADNLLVSSGNSLFEIASTSGLVSRVAGNGTAGFSGDGGLAVNASFLDPRSIAFDPSGNIVVADVENCRVRRIDHATGIIVTVAQTGGLSQNCPPQKGVIPWQPSPDDPVVDPKGNVYFDEPSVGLVARAGATPEKPIIVAGTGEKGLSRDGCQATSAKLNNPSGLAVDSAGNLFIADFVNNRVFRVDAKTKTITTVAGNGLPHRFDLNM